MEQIKQVQQLYQEGIAIKEIQRRVKISRNSIRKYIRILADSHSLSDQELADKSYQNAQQLLKTKRLHALIQYSKQKSRTGIET